VTAAIGGLVGLILGSFASVAAYRIPRDQSIVTGRSKCPSCGHVISASENVPVFSYVRQGGRCRHCDAPISARYPLVELVTAILFAATAARFGPSLQAVVYAAFFWVLVVLTVIDLEHHLLPNRIVLPAFVLGWLALVILAIAGGDMGRLFGAAAGALIFGGFFVIVALVVPAGLGGGDVKLAFVLGSFLGYLGAPGLVLVGMFLSFLVGAVIGIAVMVGTGGDRKMKVPFGPFLATGTVAAIFAGPQLLEAYLGRL
jgi:leader peptidase (prepilin peptidase) / N-methyltransferase